MGLTKHQQDEIQEHIKNKIIEKLKEYERETTSMPFHIRLFGEERMATYSFIQSCNTMLGQSIFEQVAKIIALPNFEEAETQYNLVGSVGNEETLKIEHLLRELTSAIRRSNKQYEIEEILKTKSKEIKKEKSRVDLYLKDKKGMRYFFDLTSAKPNIKEFKELKRKLLLWIALSKQNIVTSLAIPYNPYYPQPYERWTLQGLYDLEKEVMVEEDFWDFLGGQGTFLQLLDIFNKVGEEIHQEINRKIKEIAEITKKKSR